MSIGERISALRKEHDLSQGQLASMLDVSRQAVSKWENDQSCPDTLKLIQLADILDTGVEYLATGRKHPLSPSAPTAPRVIEKPVVVEKIVEVERVVEVDRIVEVENRVEVERFVERPVFRKIIRYKYRRNPIEYAGITLISCILGYLIGKFL